MKNFANACTLLHTRKISDKINRYRFFYSCQRHNNRQFISKPGFFIFSTHTPPVIIIIIQQASRQRLQPEICIRSMLNLWQDIMQVQKIAFAFLYQVVDKQIIIDFLLSDICLNARECNVAYNILMDIGNIACRVMLYIKSTLLAVNAQTEEYFSRCYDHVHVMRQYNREIERIRIR